VKICKRHLGHLGAACLFLLGHQAFADLAEELTTSSAPLETLQEGLSPRDIAGLSPSGQAKALSQALYAQAVRREMQGGFSEALPLYQSVLKADPSYLDLHLKIAFYYLQLRQPAYAQAQLLRAIEANPKAGVLHATLAYVHHLGGRFDSALSSAREAIRHTPDNPVGHRVLFEALRDQGKVEEGLAHAKTLPQIASNDPKFWIEIARVYTEVISASVRLSKDELAALILPLYDKAFTLSADPSPELLRQRGIFAQLLDRKGEALDYLKRATAVGEPNPQLNVRVAHLCTQLGRNDEAIKFFEQAHAIAPDFPLLREQLAYQYILQNQEEKAIVILEEILEKAPTRARVYSALGDLYREAKQPHKAEQNYRQALALEPSQAEDSLKLGLLLINQKRLNEAATLLAEGRQRFPQSARMALFEGIVQREQKNYSQALDLFAQAKILADDKDKEFPYSSYYYELSLTHEKAGKPQLSEATLKQGLNLEPNNENLMNALAYLWAQQAKNLPEALKLSKRSLNIAPERGEFLDTLGWIYYQLGQYEPALVALERAVQMTDSHPEVLEHLADTYAKLGRSQEAVATLQKILDQDPENRTIREKVQALMATTSSVSITPTTPP
jgi:tetratricopeptide (TPR) repeat protein